MKVLLTGATGFIGSHLARLLVREGHEICSLIREGSDLWRISDIVPMLRQVRGDLLRPDQWDVTIEQLQPEACIHCAWYAVPGKYLHAEENLSLLNASIDLSLRLANAGCKRFVGMGTCFEYDTSLGYLAETTATKPRSLYAASKLVAPRATRPYNGHGDRLGPAVLPVRPTRGSKTPRAVCDPLTNAQRKGKRDERGAGERFSPC